MSQFEILSYLLKMYLILASLFFLSNVSSYDSLGFFSKSWITIHLVKEKKSDFDILISLQKFQ